MPRSFETKDAARKWVWDAFQERKLARFPFPPHDRIPNFAGAKEAADKLLSQPLMLQAEAIKVNPDAPQRFVRAGALERGITVYMPTPRLRGGFKRLDPNRIPESQRRRAASLSHCDDYAEDVAVTELPPMDVVVAGSVAVTSNGRRAGKGHGYSDLEFAILRELGHPAPPVVTTVHDIQVVESFPTDEHDLWLTLIVTPQRLIEADPDAPPAGIDWDLLSDEDLDEMPILRDLKG